MTRNPPLWSFLCLWRLKPGVVHAQWIILYKLNIPRSLAWAYDVRKGPDIERSEVHTKKSRSYNAMPTCEHVYIWTHRERGKVYHTALRWHHMFTSEHTKHVLWGRRSMGLHTCQINNYTVKLSLPKSINPQHHSSWTCPCSDLHRIVEGNTWFPHPAPA